MMWSAIQLLTGPFRARPQLVNIDEPEHVEASDGQKRRNKLLLKDYKKFYGFRPCGMKFEDEVPKDERCNMCPPRILPPCRDEDHYSYNPRDKFAKTKKHFRNCRPDDFEWPPFPPNW